MELESPLPREKLLRLIDRLYKILTEATLAREQERLGDAHRLLLESVEAYENMSAALAAVDAPTRKELMPLVLDATAVEALLQANTYAAERTLAENRVHYGMAISAATRASGDAFQGRARSCFGAVLLHFGMYAEAATELQNARQCLRTNELGSWVQATTRLAHAYMGLNRLTDATAVLHETVGAFEAAPYQRPRALTSHHIAAATLLARLRVRNGERSRARKLVANVKQRLKAMPGLAATPEYKEFQALCSMGYLLYELRLKLRSRQLHI